MIEEDISQTQKRLIKERSQIIALNHAGISTTQIAIFIDRHKSTVVRWIKRSEQNVGRLQDYTRSGYPPIFTDLT